MYMKANLLLIALLAGAYVSAQQVSEKEMKKHIENVQKSKEKGTIIWDLDTVYNAGVPYCIVVEKSNGFLQPNDFSVRNLQNVELIYVKYAYYYKPFPAPPNTIVQYYTYYFTDTQNKSEITFNTKVYKTVVEENLINGSQISSDAEAKFVSLNGMRYTQEQNAATVQPVVIVNNTGGGIVQRNRNAGFSVINGQVRQDNVMVGTVQMSQMAENGIIVKTIVAFLPDGTKVAEATCNGLDAHNWNVITLKDNRSYWVNSSFNNDASDIVRYLIGAYYM